MRPGYNRNLETTTVSLDSTIPCTLCAQPTRMLGTKLCDRCWELKTRITHDIDLAKRIIKDIEDGEET